MLSFSLHLTWCMGFSQSSSKILYIQYILLISIHRSFGSLSPTFAYLPWWIYSAPCLSTCLHLSSHARPFFNGSDPLFTSMQMTWVSIGMSILSLTHYLFLLFSYNIIPYGYVSLQITIAFTPEELVYPNETCRAYIDACCPYRWFYVSYFVLL